MFVKTSLLLSAAYMKSDTCSVSILWYTDAVSMH